MQAHVFVNVAENKALTFWGFVALVIGSIFFCGGAFLMQGWLQAEAPPKKVVSLYITPLAKVVPGYSFSPGYPSITISMDEFRSKSAGLPYIVSYSKKWEVGGNMDRSDWYISYMMKMKDTDMYLVSNERVPTFDVPYYEQSTAFNPQDKIFFSVVTETSYKAFGWSIVLMLVSAVVAGVGGCILFDLFRPPHKRFFR